MRTSPSRHTHSQPNVDSLLLKVFLQVNVNCIKLEIEASPPIRFYALLVIKSGAYFVETNPLLTEIHSQTNLSYLFINVYKNVLRCSEGLKYNDMTAESKPVTTD